MNHIHMVKTIRIKVQGVTVEHHNILLFMISFVTDSFVRQLPEKWSEQSE